MEHLHQILNYSYCPLDIEHYVDDFLLQREEKIKEIKELSSNGGEPDLLKAPTAPVDTARELVNGAWMDPHPEPGGDKDLDTYGFLCGVLRGISQGKPVGEAETGVLNKLQKKFEVYYRLFDRYDRRLRRKGTSFKKMHIYAMFSIVLTLRYLLSGNLNDLNSAVKLNDVLLFSGWPVQELYSALIAWSLYLELTAVRIL